MAGGQGRGSRRQAEDLDWSQQVLNLIAHTEESSLCSPCKTTGSL